jgi:hypothetical protein
MCYFCFDVSAPTFPRNGSAFPRKIAADPADTVAEKESPRSGILVCDSPDAPTEPVSAWPKRRGHLQEF